MIKAPIDFEVIKDGKRQIIPILVPWSISMRSIVIKEIKKLEVNDSTKVIHAFHDDVCLMRKFRIGLEEYKS